MPATAGHVKMPANNRIHSSAALRTSAIWSESIGHDPYAEKKASSLTEDSIALAKDLMSAVKSQVASKSNAGERGACKKCGGLGHLTFQCRNFLSVKNKDEIKSSSEESDDSSNEGDEELAYIRKLTAGRDRSPVGRQLDGRQRDRSPSRKDSDKKSKKKHKKKKKDKKKKKHSGKKGSD